MGLDVEQVALDLGRVSRGSVSHDFLSFGSSDSSLSPHFLASFLDNPLCCWHEMGDSVGGVVGGVRILSWVAVSLFRYLAGIRAIAS